MKSIFAALAAIVLLAGLYIAFCIHDKNPVPVELTNNQSAPSAPQAMRGMVSSEVIPVGKALPVNPNIIYKPVDFGNATEDQATMELLAKFKHWTDLGEVRTAKNNQQQLWIGNRMVFEAKVIQPFRTMSDKGTIVLAAVTETVIKTVDEEKITNSQLPASIWAIDTQGQAMRISPPNTSGATPLISPDGNLVAFSADGSGSKTSFCANEIYVVDLVRGEYRTYHSAQHYDEYKVWPVEWAESGDVLKVLEDWGETGGHMLTKSIRLK